MQLTLAVHDGDGYGSEDQEAGASHSNPEENITDGILCYFLACSCRKKGENEERPGMSADGIPSCGLLVLALCWGAEGGHIARRLLMSPSVTESSVCSKSNPLFWCDPSFGMLVTSKSP